MKQLETKNQKLTTNILNFYREIGIYITVSDKLLYKEPFLFRENKENKSQKQNHNIQKDKDIKIKKLEYLFKNIEDCKLKKTSSNFVGFYGNINSKLLIIDGPPDMEEDKKGISFVSNKGFLFEKMLHAINIKKDETFIAKSIPWRPPGNRYPSNDEIKICRPFIVNLINLLQPKFILCLGEVPTNQILGLNESIIKLRGKWRTLNLNEYNHKFLVLPTFSVSHLLHRPDLKKYAWADMKLLRDTIKENVTTL